MIIYEYNYNYNKYFHTYCAFISALMMKLTSLTAEPEATGAFRKWRGIGQKGHFCIWSIAKSNDFMSFTAKRKRLKIWSPYNVGNAEMASCKKGTFFLAQKKGHFLTLKSGGGGTCPHCLPGSTAPVPRIPAAILVVLNSAVNLVFVESQRIFTKMFCSVCDCSGAKFKDDNFAQNVE
jgi:hypothetical protein